MTRESLMTWNVVGDVPLGEEGCLYSSMFACLSFGFSNVRMTRSRVHWEWPGKKYTGLIAAVAFGWRGDNKIFVCYHACLCCLSFLSQ